MGRLPVAVFTLAFRKSLPMLWSDCVLTTAPQKQAIFLLMFQDATYISSIIIGIPPHKPCRWRRHSSPQMRVNRFVFLNLPMLSLGNHLGLMASPQSPFPTGYVTLLVDNRSPPLRLMLPHSREQGILLFLLSVCIPSICTPDYPARGALYVRSTHPLPGRRCYIAERRTWLGRSIDRSLSRYGQILCAGCFLLVLGSR